MRIWIVNQYALPSTESGGTRHFTLASELLGRGHEVYIIASNIHYASRQPMEKYAGLQQFEGVPFLWLKTPAYSGNGVDRLWNNLVFTWRLLTDDNVKRLPRPDVIVGSTPHPFAVWAAGRLATRFRVPLVMEVRDLWPQSLVDLGALAPRHPLVGALGILERYLYRRSERIISLMPKALDYIVRMGADPAKITWIPNGVDLRLVPSVEFGRSSRPFTIMYVGSHGSADGLETLVQAAYRLKCEHPDIGIRFRLIGDGPAKCNLVRRANQLGLDNVAFEDPVPKNQIYQFLQQADAFLVLVRDSPLYKWGLSFNKLFDYFAMARPIIFAGAVSENPVDLADAGVTIPPDDANALLQAVRALSERPLEERAAMGRNGRHFVEKHHDMHKLSFQFEAVLEQAVSGGILGRGVRA